MRRSIYMAAYALLALAGCNSHGGTGGGGSGDMGGDMSGGMIDGSSNDLSSTDLKMADLMPYPDLGGWTDPNWVDPTGTRNLTNEGTSDWVHWGLSNEASLDRRSGVTPVLNATVIGSGTLHQYTDNHVIFDWSNGSPTGSVTGTPTGVFILGVNNGFKVTVPAESTPHTLRVYLSAFGADYKLTAHMSDGSAPDYVDAVVNPTGKGGLYRMYTFTYKALNQGQTFSVSWIDTVDHFGGGNVTLQAATLQ
jgi:hypothetical protein